MSNGRSSVERSISYESGDNLVANRYRIEKKISKNDKSTIYLAFDTKDDSHKILKRISMFSTEDQNQLKQMIREEKILCMLESPFIVRYHQSFLNHDDLVIVTEYCEGGDLARFLRDLRKNDIKLPEEKIVYWLSQLVSACNYLHRKRILHRNIKPANILLKNNVCKLADMGISRTLDDSGTHAYAKTFIGTPYYMSPEVVKNNPYNAKSDIWSLGCVLYEMATYQRPFVGEKLVDIFNSVMEDPAPSIINLYSKDLNSILKKMLSKDPADRPSASELMEERLIFDNTKFLIQSSLNHMKERRPAEQMESLINSLSLMDPLIDEAVFGGLEYDDRSTIRSTPREGHRDSSKRYDSL